MAVRGREELTKSKESDGSNGTSLCSRTESVKLTECDQCEYDVDLCVDDIACAKALLRGAGNKAVNWKDDNGITL